MASTDKPLELFAIRARYGLCSVVDTASLGPRALRRGLLPAPCGCPKSLLCPSREKELANKTGVHHPNAITRGP